MPCKLSNDVKKLDFFLFSMQATDNKVINSQTADTTIIATMRTRLLMM